jgi:hypothetical protein
VLTQRVLKLKRQASEKDERRRAELEITRCPEDITQSPSVTVTSAVETERPALQRETCLRQTGDAETRPSGNLQRLEHLSVPRNLKLDTNRLVYASKDAHFGRAQRCDDTVGTAAHRSIRSFCNVLRTRSARAAFVGLSPAIVQRPILTVSPVKTW